MYATLQQYGPPGGRVTWNNPKSLAEYGPPGGIVTWNNPKSLAEYSDQGYPVPFFFPGAGQRGRTTLGAFDPSSLLASVTNPDTSLLVNSTLLYGGLALLGIVLVWHYVDKGAKKYRRYARKRTQKAQRRQQLKAELASL